MAGAAVVGAVVDGDLLDGRGSRGGDVRGPGRARCGGGGDEKKSCGDAAWDEGFVVMTRSSGATHTRRSRTGHGPLTAWLSQIHGPAVGRRTRVEMTKANTVVEPAERREQLREALALWRGEPLAEIADEPFGPCPRRSAVSKSCACVRSKTASTPISPASGHAELVPELEAIVARYPLRERARGQLMLALYHADRQADALRAYQDARRLLVEEVGLEPACSSSSCTPRSSGMKCHGHGRPWPPPTKRTSRRSRAPCSPDASSLCSGSDVAALAEQLAHRFDYPEDVRELTRVRSSSR